MNDSTVIEFVHFHIMIQKMKMFQIYMGYMLKHCGRKGSEYPVPFAKETRDLKEL